MWSIWVIVLASRVELRELGGIKEEKTKVPVQLKMPVEIKEPVAFLCQNSNSSFCSIVDWHNHCSISCSIWGTVRKYLSISWLLMVSWSPHAVMCVFSHWCLNACCCQGFLPSTVDRSKHWASSLCCCLSWIETIVASPWYMEAHSWMLNAGILLLRGEGSPVDLGLASVALLVDFMGFPSSTSVWFSVIETCRCLNLESEILIAK